MWLGRITRGAGKEEEWRYAQALSETYRPLVEFLVEKQEWREQAQWRREHRNSSPGPVAAAASADSYAYAYYSPSALTPRSQFVAPGIDFSLAKRVGTRSPIFPLISLLGGMRSHDKPFA